MKRTVTIALTNMCNLNCIYCYETNKQNVSISEQTLLKIIDYEMSLEDHVDVEFNLFGGEPFLQFELIKRTYEFLVSSNYEKGWSIGLITNGTLIHGEIQEWLKNNKINLTCTLSIDGTKEMHNKNRCNSFDSIDLDFFVDTFSTPYAKMTISEHTVSDLSEGLLFLQKSGFWVNATLAYGTNWTDKLLKILDRELEKYFDEVFSSEMFISDKCSMLDLPYKKMYNSKGKKYRSCDAGDTAKAYSTDGRVFPCYMFLPSSITENYYDAMTGIKFPGLIVDDNNVNDKCKNCPLFSVCQNCYANNFKLNKNIYVPDQGICEANKIIFNRKALFWANMWKNKKIELSKEEEYMLLDSLIAIGNM